MGRDAEVAEVPVRRVHLPPQGPARVLPAGRAAGQTAAAPRRTGRNKGNCSPPGGITPSSPTPPWAWSRRTSSTGTTPSWSRSSRSSRTAQSLICRQARTWRTQPGRALRGGHRVQPRPRHRGRRGHGRARWATVRRKIINVPARVATTGRRLILHLPSGPGPTTGRPCTPLPDPHQPRLPDHPAHQAQPQGTPNVEKPMWSIEIPDWLVISEAPRGGHFRLTPRSHTPPTTVDSQ